MSCRLSRLRRIAASSSACLGVDVGAERGGGADLVACRLDLRHPAADEGAMPLGGGVELAGQRGGDAAAAGVAHDDDLLDLELGDGELDRRRRAVGRAVGLVGRDEIGDVAHDEHLAGCRIEDARRVDPAVGAGDDHDPGRLTDMGERVEARRAGRYTARRGSGGNRRGANRTRPSTTPSRRDRCGVRPDAVRNFAFFTTPRA